MRMFAETTKKAPLFNTPDLTSVFRTPLPLDNQFLLRALEVILLPHSPLRIQKEYPHSLEVIAEEYSASPLYIDKRFVREVNEPRTIKRTLPSRETLLRRLRSYPKRPYIWGGNAHEGVAELLSYFPPKAPLSHYEWLTWQFRGVDCSGLLYDISDGSTPRNTRQLCDFGYEVSSPKPLDMIVWPGHVLFYLKEDLLIESKAGDGITISRERLRRNELEPYPYQIRRWV